MPRGAPHGALEQDGNTIMTMSMHTGRREPTARSFAPVARDHLGATKRFFTGVLIVLLAGAAVAAAMTLKTAYYLSHFSP